MQQEHGQLRDYPFHYSLDLSYCTDVLCLEPWVKESCDVQKVLHAWDFLLKHISIFAFNDA